VIPASASSVSSTCRPPRATSTSSCGNTGPTPIRTGSNARKDEAAAAGRMFTRSLDAFLLAGARGNRGSFPVNRYLQSVAESGRGGSAPALMSHEPLRTPADSRAH